MKTSDFKCVTCVEGKQTRKSFISEGSRAKDLLELIHSDVCGPISPQSIGGAKYFVTFIDDYSKKVFVYTMKAKSEVYSKVVNYKNFAEKQLNKSIKTLRNDGGMEYMNKQMHVFLSKNGIKHEKGATYPPQQNGVSERMDRTLIERLRCLLFEANMTKGFWAEAIFAAVEIINVLPKSSIGNKSPDELWFGKKLTSRVSECSARVQWL